MRLCAPDVVAWSSFSERSVLIPLFICVMKLKTKSYAAHSTFCPDDRPNKGCDGDEPFDVHHRARLAATTMPVSVPSSEPGSGPLDGRQCRCNDPAPSPGAELNNSIISRQCVTKTTYAATSLFPSTSPTSPRATSCSFVESAAARIASDRKFHPLLTHKLKIAALPFQPFSRIPPCCCSGARSYSSVGHGDKACSSYYLLSLTGLM